MSAYHGPERRDLSECPLTAEQAYDILNNLKHSVSVQTKMLEQQSDIIKRLDQIEKYIFAGRAVFVVVTAFGVFVAWSVGFLHEIREFFK